MIESAKRYAILWNKWNSGDIEAEEMLLQLDSEGCFLEEVCRDWAKIIDEPYEKVLKANIKMFHSSPTSTNEESSESR